MDVVSLLIYIVVGLVLPLGIVFGTLLYVFPHYLLSFFMRARKLYVGMKIHYVGDEDFIFCYGERNQHQPGRSSLVFIHGFTSSKDQWITCFRNLPSDLHMIAVDLPGHGASSIPREEHVLNVPFIVKKMRKFLELIDMSTKPVHLVGSSLGGAISGVYAANYPQYVAKVSLICPAMDTPVSSPFVRDLKEASKNGVENLTVDHCALLPQNVEGVRKLLECVCYNRDILKIHDQIFKGFLTLQNPRTEFYLKVFRVIADDRYFDLLVSLAPKITMPSQLIWGRQDEVIHVSGADALKARLPNCRHVDIIDRCGHAVDLDRPGAFNKALLTFIKEPVHHFEKKAD